jgi:hypothetical protein
MGLEELKAFESELDDRIRSLPIWKLPIRAVLTAVHAVIDNLFNGSRNNQEVSPRPEAGASAGGRLSYLVPLLLTCPSEPIGANGADALAAVQEVDTDGAQRKALLTYGHFSEVMPEVHRGYYSVQGDATTGFTLKHATQNFAEYEVQDIVLNEISLSFVAASPSMDKSLFDQQAKTAPKSDLGLESQILTSVYEYYRTRLSEPPILTEAGYVQATGASRDEFERFRAALFAIADYCKGIAEALTRRLQQEGFPDTVWEELLEWLSVNWTESFFVGRLKVMTGLEFDLLNRLLSTFSLDFRATKKLKHQAGDGFFPPLAKLEEAYLFNPDLLKVFLPARNVLYALSRTDKKHYNDFVSQHLEPELIRAAAELFSSFDELEIRTNHKWAQGEFDLLIYSKTENTALHIQAKAAIPPQGARMVQAVESRTSEGIEQLKRFRELAPREQDAVLSDALKYDVRNVEIVDVLLSRSCFGTDRVWSAIGTAVPVNLSLLKSIVMKSTGRSIALKGFADTARTELIRIVQLARPQFVDKQLVFEQTSLRLPMLELNMHDLREEQMRIWGA